eukprot:scaffold192754_cov44-Tisochrysis_lutea.AAC.1
MDTLDSDPIPTIMGGDFNCVEDSAQDSRRIGEAIYTNAHGGGSLVPPPPVNGPAGAAQGTAGTR